MVQVMKRMEVEGQGWLKFQNPNFQVKEHEIPL